MKNITIQVTAEAEKINAIKLYIADHNTNLDSELTDYIGVLYEKYVPDSVRNFIERRNLQENQERKKKPRRTATKKAVSGAFGSSEENTRKSD